MYQVFERQVCLTSSGILEAYFEKFLNQEAEV